MAKKIFYDADARQRVLKGAEILNDAVKTTLGPRGRSVVIGRPFGNPIVTKDGVTVAKNVEVEETDETLGFGVGASLIKEVASKLNDKAGDGTTTVTVLTYNILKEANKLIVAGYDPVQLRKGLEVAAKEALENLEKLSEDVADNNDRLVQVATISASDAEIGQLIANTVEKVGNEGVVTVEQGQGLGLESEVVEGFTFDRGYISPYMVTDQARMEATFNNPTIIITDKKVSNIQEFVPVIEKVMQIGKKDLLLIADDVDGEALATLILNKMKGAFNTVAVKAPNFGDNRKSILEDIALLTGGKVISSETGDDFATVDPSYFGTAKRVLVTKERTTIIEGAGSVEERIKQIDAQIESTTTDYEKENLRSRKASLTEKVAVIKVGGVSETEIEEKKFRVDDAVASVKSALKEGIVPGGGVSLLNISAKLELTNIYGMSKSAQYGYGLLIEALRKPFITLLENSGISPDKWIDKLNEEGSQSGMGINVLDENPSVVDLKKEGVIDPTTVTKEVIKNAVSVAGTAITMGALVVDIPEKEAQPDMPPMGMM